MLIKWVNWFFGYVEFCFTGGFADGFVNNCYSRKINIKNIRSKGGALCARCSIKTYKWLHIPARENGGRLRILKKRGLPFMLRPLKNRWGVFCGMLFFVFFISFMGGFIWNVTVVGNETLEASKIVDYLAQNGFKTGARWADTDKENLEFAVMADFEEIAWISINHFGCLAQVEIREATPKPEIEDNNTITNVTAKKDGVIVKVTALGGWSAVETGDAVTEGDLLISGVYEADETESLKKNHFAHAHGTVIAKTSYEITVTVSREQSEKECTEEKEYKTLYFFGIEIPLYIDKSRTNTVSDYQKEYLVLNGFRLPIGIYTETRRTYTQTKYSATDEELRSIAAAELEKKEASELKDCEIIGKSEEEQITESGLTLTVSYSLLEDIGEEKEIIFSQSDDDNS